MSANVWSEIYWQIELPDTDKYYRMIFYGHADMYI